MHILILTTKFPRNIDSPYLTNELSSECVKRGSEVTVINIDWHDDNGGDLCFEYEGANVFNFSKISALWLPRILRLPISWSMSSVRAYFKIYNKISKEKFDVCLMTTPMTIFYFFIFFGKKTKKIKLISLCWDFFPIHQLKLGLLPSWISPILKWIEKKIYEKCEKICVISNDYKIFFQSNYFLKRTDNIVITGLWGGARVEDGDDSNYANLEHTIVFGGQLVRGRGLDNFVNLCKICERVDKKIRILVMGKGDVKEDLQKKCIEASLSNINFMDPLPRKKYNNLIKNCLAGLVSLDVGNKCPSFPSKIVDYTRSGLPLIVLDSENASIQEFVEKNGIGFYIHPDEEDRIFSSILKLSSDDRLRQEMSDKSFSCYTRDFNVGNAVDLIINGI